MGCNIQPDTAIPSIKNPRHTAKPPITFDKSLRIMKTARLNSVSSLFQEEVSNPESKASLYFKGDILKPKGNVSVNTAQPDANYTLNYAYGYKQNDANKSIFFTHLGQIAFTTAAVGVILDVATNTQTFFGGKFHSKNESLKIDYRQHTSDIVSIAISNDRKSVATGQLGDKPIIYVWNCDTKEILHCIKLTKGCMGVKIIQFSPDNKHLIFVDMKFTLYGYNLKESRIEFSYDLPNKTVLDIAVNTDMIAILYKDAILFYVAESNKLHTSNNISNQEEFSCIASNNISYYIGTSKGNIHLYDHRQIIDTKSSHEQPITCIAIEKEILLCGYHNNAIEIFDTELDSIKYIKISHIPISIDYFEEIIVIGEDNGSILIVNTNSIDCTSKTILHTHTNDVWKSIIAGDRIITVGDDNRVITYNYRERKADSVTYLSKLPGESKRYGEASLTKLPDNQCSRAIDINNKCHHIAIGCNSGEVQIRKSVDEIEVLLDKISASDMWIECLKYSPNGIILAVGTQHGEIKCYSANENYSIKSVYNEQKSYISAIDWTANSKFLRTNNGNLELCIYNMETFKRDDSKGQTTITEIWSNHSCPVSWGSLGVFPSSASETHINCICNSHSNQLIVAGDEYGLINIYNNPCPHPLGNSISIRAHSTHVKDVIFSEDDKFLFTIGGSDRTILQWERA